MAATEEMTRIAVQTRPHACCLVPERRSELTTEGGLDAAGTENSLAPVVRRLVDAGIRVSLFLDPELRQIEAAARLRAPAIELHTGTYCEAWVSGDRAAAGRELERLAKAAKASAAQRIEVHAGHGLDFETAAHLAALPEVRELNIGHFLIGEALFIGLAEAIIRMRAAIARGRAEASSQAAAGAAST
jgi:pyridoxine 5-phosphate synthase